MWRLLCHAEFIVLIPDRICVCLVCVRQKHIMNATPFITTTPEHGSHFHMNIKTIAGILLLPMLAIAAWFLFPIQTVPHAPRPEMFRQVGNIVRNNPGLVPDTWYLVYEEPGASGRTQRLEFNGGSRCGSTEMLKICDITFQQGERVHVEGFRLKDYVVVTKLIYLPSPL